MKSSPGEYTLPLGSSTLHTRDDLSRMYKTRHIWRADRHCNAEYELHIVLRGVCQVDVEERHFSLREQQAILIAPGQYHLPCSLPGEFERFSLSFTLSHGPLPDALRQQIPVCRVFAVSPEITSLCRMLVREYSLKNTYWQEAQPALLAQLYIAVFRLLHVDQPVQPVQTAQREVIRTDLIDDYFERNFAANATLSDLSRKVLHLSRRQAARVLEEHYGMGFQQKLISTRMDHAAWLLRTTDLQAGQIAGAVGYTSETAFYQAFRKHFQVTPQQYRKRSISPAQE
ncbi:MAG: helix-turn-helix transcriptional regulator [Oscillospiraceae bacterium]|nr:helix-turn-helix transcriptional regulator [Oscillospiraceae bacterium]